MFSIYRLHKKLRAWDNLNVILPVVLPDLSQFGQIVLKHIAIQFKGFERSGEKFGVFRHCQSSIQASTHKPAVSFDEDLGFVLTPLPTST